MKVTTFVFAFSSIAFAIARPFPSPPGEVVAATKFVPWSLSEPAKMGQISAHSIFKPDAQPSGSTFDVAKWKMNWNVDPHPLHYLENLEDPRPSGFTSEQKAKWMVDPATHFMKKPKVSQSSGSNTLKGKADFTTTHYPKKPRYTNLNVAEYLGSKPGPSKFNIHWTEDPPLADLRIPPELRFPVDWKAHICHVLDGEGCKLGTSANARLVVHGDKRYAKLSGMKPRYRGSREVDIWPKGTVYRVPPTDWLGWWRERQWLKANPDVRDRIVPSWVSLA